MEPRLALRRMTASEGAREQRECEVGNEALSNFLRGKRAGMFADLLAALQALGSVLAGVYELPRGAWGAPRRHA